MPSVSTQITWIVVGYAVLVAVLALVVALRSGERPGWLDQMAWMLEALLVVRALAGLSAFSGDGPDSTSTYVGYLIASVCVLPIAMKSVEGDRAVWSSAVVAVAAVAVGVIVVRLQMTGMSDAPRSGPHKVLLARLRDLRPRRRRPVAGAADHGVRRRARRLLALVRGRDHLRPRLVGDPSGRGRSHRLRRA